jgi:hypothetical protein
MEHRITLEEVKGNTTQVAGVKPAAEASAASQPLIIAEQDAPLVIDFVNEAGAHRNGGSLRTFRQCAVFHHL